MSEGEGEARLEFNKESVSDPASKTRIDVFRVDSKRNNSKTESINIRPIDFSSRGFGLRV